MPHPFLYVSHLVGARGREEGYARGANQNKYHSYLPSIGWNDLYRQILKNRGMRNCSIRKKMATEIPSGSSDLFPRTESCMRRGLTSRVGDFHHGKFSCDDTAEDVMG